MKLLFLCVILTADPSSAATTMTLTVQDVLDRIDRFDPSARQKAAEQLRAEVLLRRAQWNQVSGGIALNTNYGIYANELLPSVKISDGSANSWFDRLTANILAQITFPIYAGGGISGAINAAGARLNAARYDKRALTRDLKRAALSAFAQLFAADHQLHIAETALARSEALAEIALRRRVSGISTEADVARAALNKLVRIENVEARRGDRNIAEAILRAALIIDQDVHLIGSGDIAAVKSVGAKTKTTERLEVSSLREQVIAARSDRTVAFSGWLPRLEAFGTLSYGNGSPIFIGGQALNLGAGLSRFGVFSGSATAGLRLTWTGWDFFITRDAVAKADADKAVAEALLAAQEQIVAREIGETAARREQAERRLQALSGSREVAEKALRLARVRYETGNALLSEVLDAELEAIAVESRKVQADYDAAVAHLDRLRAEGAEL